RSLLTHITMSPRFTCSVAGLKLMPSMVTVCVRCSPKAELLASTAMPQSASAATLRRDSNSVTLLSHRGLHALRVLEVSDERRSHLHHQGFQLFVLRVRNQGLVERVEHRLVVRDLVVDIGPVERTAF